MLWIDKFDTCIKFFSDISFKYFTLYCHFSLIFVTLHVLVFLFYKKKNAMVYILLSSSTMTNMYEWHFFSSKWD